MLNKVIIMGRLTADPELRQTPSGISTCRFSVAVDRGYKSKDTGERQTDFIRVTAWRQQAEFVSRYFHKGKSIFVLGALQNRNWTDQNGQKRYDFEVVADEISFVESKSAEEGYAAANRSFASPAEPVQRSAGTAFTPPSVPDSAFEDLASDDDLPF